MINTYDNNNPFHVGNFGLNRDPDTGNYLPRRSDVTDEISDSSGHIDVLVKNKINVLSKINLKVTQAIRNKQPIPIMGNLFPIVSSTEVLTLGYQRIKQNDGAMTPGTQNQTIDEFSQQRIDLIQQRLKDGTFKFPDVRRIWRPKPGKGSDAFWKDPNNLITAGRPLGLPDFDAKVVQSAINLVLTSIYEPIFDSLDVSFGFRPKRGCHDALRKLDTQAQALPYAIEGDIKGAFNNLQHETLIKILNKRISDKKFLDLIYKCCRAGIFDELQNSRTDSLLGVPQGGIMSPTLWNIYMHEFDLYISSEITDLLDSLNKRQGRSLASPPTNPRYKQIQNQRATAWRRYKTYMEPNTNSPYNLDSRGRQILIPKVIRDGTSRLRQLPPEMQEDALQYKRRYILLGRLQRRTPSKLPGNTRLRYHYTRYADDWVFFVNGTAKLAWYIRNKIASFLKYHLGLTLAMDKTKITDIRREPVRFLSFTVYLQKQHVIQARTGARRVGGVRPYIGIDRERLLTRLKWKGFLDHSGRPREQPALSVLPDHEIISKYNSIIMGTVNYYAPIIRARSSLNYFIYIYEYSCYKTLCQRHRTSIRKLLKKHGHPLKVHIPTPHKKHESKVISLLTTKHYWPNLKEVSSKIKTNIEKKYEERDPYQTATSDFLNNAKAYYRTRFKLNSRCVICGDPKVQMHHIRHVRKYSETAKQGFDRIHSLLNRKQIPVCKHHHKGIHDGIYDSISLSELYDSRLGQPESYLLIPQAPSEGFEL